MLLKIIPVEISGPLRTVKTYALLDDGSTITLINKMLSKNIGAKGQHVNLKLTGINNHEMISSKCERIPFEICGNIEKYKIENAVAVPGLSLPRQTISKELVRLIAKEESVFIQPYKDIKPEILIGQDNWQLLVTRDLRALQKSSLALSLSPLGWSVHGPINFSLKSFTPSVCMIQDKNAEINFEVSLDEVIKNYFQIDSLGVREIDRPNYKNMRSLEILKNTTRCVGDVWETGLLWNENREPQVDSKATALKRFFTIEKRLDRDKEFASLYYKEMERFIENGYAKKVDDEMTRERVWYLPHFGVTNPNKRNKVRIVFDAAAKSDGISLNDQLDSGPDLLQSLPGVILRFRLYAVAVKADIKDMYLRVKMREQDRGAQRFFWRGNKRKGDPEVFEMTCLIFGAKPSQCSALYVINANAHRFAEAKKPEVLKSIKYDSYADDFLSSRATVQEAEDLARDVTEINAKGNFIMHGWASNEACVLKNFPETARDNRTTETQICHRGGERALGLSWDVHSDTLGFNTGLNKISKDVVSGVKKPTKREFLAVIMSVFDPLGLIAPFTLNSKLLMQDIWRSGVGWDDQIRDEEHTGWVTWIQNLNAVSLCQVPRCLTPKHERYTEAQLHVFCDASLKAYSAVTYLRFKVENAPAHVSLVMAKSRVAPLKFLSVPRLELQAALLGSRLIKTVAEELGIKIAQRFLWSDSATVLHWIRSEPRTRQIYVSHRLGEIGELTTISEWRWVPTDLNPADYATRWVNDPLDSQSPWFAGPEFLRQSEAQWPKEKSINESEKRAIDDMEVRKAKIYVIKSVIEELPITGKFLGWRGLLAVARRLQIIVARWKKRPVESEAANDLVSCENYWFREIQSVCFPNEIIDLKKKETINKNSKIINVQPFMDKNGILRAKGRVTNINEMMFNNQPIILDGKHPACKLLITEYHRRFYHASSDAVVNELRQKFYIVGLRKTLRFIIHNCLFCKLRRAKPKNPLMGSLPAGRLAYKQRPFSHCGVDYFGPMLVKIGRRREKRWGVLFTCLTTRAIHLELAHSLTTSSAIMALQRLAARRGSPSVMYSDNGTNFRGACKELSDGIATMDKNKLHKFALQNGMKWIFNPPDAPHMGGAWERLIRSVKVALIGILKDQITTEEILYTLLAEIEHSVNSRPLTHVSVDPQDNEALTPNHFLIGSSSGELRLGTYEAQNICPRKQWRIAQSFADNFWKRWLREYLPSLITRQKWFVKTDSLKINDLVLIADFQVPRNFWRKGIITEVFPGADGEVRVAKIRTSSGDFIRPVHKLICLLSEKKVQN